MIYIKDMDMPVDCLACRISCKHESYRVPGRPEDCPLEEAKTGDLIRRADAIEAVMAEGRKVYTSEYANAERVIYEADAVEALSMLQSAEAVSREEYDQLEALYDAIRIYDSSADAVQGWIPCSERLPEDLEAVNVTWVNHNPPVYYQYTKDVPNADTAVYYRGVWYWWDSTICDVLGEYGEKCNAEQIDKDIEILAWQPLPKPYKGGDSE